FAVGPRRVLCALDRAGRPWSASAPAQAAATASLLPESVAWLDRTLRRLAKETDAVGRALIAAGLEPRPSRTSFLCARVPETSAAGTGRTGMRAGDVGGGAGTAAEALAAALECEGLRVRRCVSFGMPHH